MIHGTDTETRAIELQDSVIDSAIRYRMTTNQGEGGDRALAELEATIDRLLQHLEGSVVYRTEV